jgi:aminopeptidase N
MPNRVAVRHLSLELTVDFARKTLAGKAELSLVRHDATAHEVILDSDGLVIEAVTDCATHQPLAHTLGERAKVTAQALSIALPERGDCIDVAYHTGPDAGALLWVDPAGTSGKVHPMLFTQSQAILARTWIPLQDTPGVRFTYDATIHVPAGQWAVMSAENPQQVAADGTYRFVMRQPIPSYLMALAVGELAFRPIGPHTGVYAEPSVVDAAAHEFGDVDAMVATAEKLYGPYRWGRYDMLVLPPSFPFGGMENPRLSFLTPTAITGDKSLVSLIAHELAHSWSGNLVTNATWNDFWLNEGVTTYVERRLMEQLRGKDNADVLWATGVQDLAKVLAEHSPKDPATFLARTMGPDQDPEDALSEIDYEKGSLLLRAMELTFGRATFDAFLRRRFDRLAFQSSDTETFEAEANAELFAKYDPGWKLATWLHEGGLPATPPLPTSARVTAIEALATRAALPPSGWTTADWVVYLRAIPEAVTAAQLEALDAAYHLTTGNSEILMHWLPRLIDADVQRAAPVVEGYLLSVGRRRMVEPVYKALMAKNESWRALARAVFVKAAPLYHPVTRTTIAGIVK